MKFDTHILFKMNVRFHFDILSDVQDFPKRYYIARVQKGASASITKNTDVFLKIASSYPGIIMRKAWEQQ